MDGQATQGFQEDGENAGRAGGQITRSNPEATLGIIQDNPMR